MKDDELIAEGMKPPCGRTLGHGETCQEGYLCGGCSYRRKASARIEALAAEVERKDAALRFYADPASWKTKGHPQIDWNDKPILHDKGERARAALQPQEKVG